MVGVYGRSDLWMCLTISRPSIPGIRMSVMPSQIDRHQIFEVHFFLNISDRSSLQLSSEQFKTNTLFFENLTKS